MGWKDILKPIRDRFDDLLPPSNADEAERLKRRQQDALKGFAYFESFDDLEAWKPEDVDATQVSNTPILQRESPHSWYRRAKITLIHDYAGNYHDYESCQGFEVDNEYYSCEYLQFVDAFVYFSHRLVCVPPPSWTNSLHRNGVESLGTFIVEPGGLHVERMLQTEAGEDGQERSPRNFVIAKQLAKIAAAYGFDGWLINIEKTFPNHSWDLEKLAGFLKQLRQEMGDRGSVIWYDALTINNQVQYQNGLTSENIPFSQASGSLLTNYSWDYEKLSETIALVDELKMSGSDVAFGIDVWAQCKQPKENPRITWPRNGGGGTNTGTAVYVLCKRFSAGIFGPAMAYEHFGKYGRAVDRAIWEALPLPNDLACDCSKDARKFHRENRQHPITRWAERYDAGSRHFFFTNFERAFAKRSPGESIRAQLGAQSIFPSPPDDGSSAPPSCRNSDKYYYTCLSDNPSRLLITTKASASSRFVEGDIAYGPAVNPSEEPKLPCWRTGYSRESHLFKLALNCEEPLHVRIRFRALLPCQSETGCIYMTFGDSTQKVLRGQKIADDGTMLVDEIIYPRVNKEGHPSEAVPSSSRNPNEIIGLGIRLDAFDPTVLPASDTVLEIYEIRIQPAASASRCYNIRDVHVEERGGGHGELPHSRLCWQVRERISKHRECPAERPRLADGTLDKRPWSGVTGPFSHFGVHVDGEQVGRAYALEFVLPGSVREKLGRGDECKVEVVGETFWGEEWESGVVELPDLARDWELVG